MYLKIMIAILYKIEILHKTLHKICILHIFI